MSNKKKLFLCEKDNFSFISEVNVNNTDYFFLSQKSMLITQVIKVLNMLILTISKELLKLYVSENVIKYQFDR